MRNSMSGKEGRQTCVFTPIIQVNCNNFRLKKFSTKVLKWGKIKLTYD